MVRKLLSNSQGSGETYPTCLTVAVPLPVNPVKVPVLLREKQVGCRKGTGTSGHLSTTGTWAWLRSGHAPLPPGGRGLSGPSQLIQACQGAPDAGGEMNNKQHIHAAPVLPKDLKVLYKRKDK